MINNREFSFFEVYQKFISQSKNSRRLQPNGKKISSGTIKNYENALRLIRKFCIESGFEMRLRRVSSLNQREIRSEKKYWDRFYYQFTEYLYKSCGHYDNYVSCIVKTIKTFFGYANKDLLLDVGEFHKKFYVRKEDISILVLLPEELNFFIYDSDFENSLSASLRRTKDTFVLGCTIALRFSDLINLQRSSIRISNNVWHLNLRARKTGADLMMKLPEYAVDILKKYYYRSARKSIFPKISNAHLNKNIKKLMKKAGFTNEVRKFREIRGTRKELFYHKTDTKIVYRMCDLVSTHTMRRTAITTMLSLGVPEQIVRKISGHAPGSKEFYKYVSISQSYLEQETSKMFELLKQKTLLRNSSDGGIPGIN